MNLIDLGWSELFQKEFDKLSDKELEPARIAREHKELYTVFCEKGEFRAEVTGKLRFNAKSRADFPAVGDWVAAAVYPDEGKAVINNILPRRSKFSRRAVLSGGMPETGGRTDEQVLAANIDTVFLVSGLDHDFNLRRIERFLAAAWESGAAPVIILNKADLCSDIDEAISQVESIAIGVPIHAISAGSNTGLDVITPYMNRGQTVALLGSSGVGKSTIINSLLGENRLKTTEVREDDSKGRHTTTHRELVILPTGGLIIDTPGLRLFKVWDGEESISQLFAEIEAIARQCRFSDCSHQSEPGCAIKQALKSGALEESRYENYLKLQKEQKALELRKNQKEARKQQRTFSKKIKQILKEKDELKRKGLI